MKSKLTQQNTLEPSFSKQNQTALTFNSTSLFNQAKTRPRIQAPFRDRVIDVIQFKFQPILR